MKSSRLILVSLLTASLCHAQPSQYDLADVEISLRFVPGDIGGPFTVTLSGTGAGRIEFDALLGPDVTHFEVSRDEIVGLLTDLYNVHFFSLDDEYGVTVWPELVEGRTVKVQTAVALHQDSYTTTIRLGTYEKSVVNVQGDPPGLHEIEQKIEQWGRRAHEKDNK